MISILHSSINRGARFASDELIFRFQFYIVALIVYFRKREHCVGIISILHSSINRKKPLMMSIVDTLFQFYIVALIGYIPAYPANRAAISILHSSINSLPDTDPSRTLNYFNST